MDDKTTGPTSDSAENHPNKRCPHCDAVNDGDASVCTSCSKALVAKPTKKSKRQKRPAPTEREVSLGIIESQSDSLPARPDTPMSNRFDITGIAIKLLTLVVVAAAIWVALGLRQPAEPTAPVSIDAGPTESIAAAQGTVTSTPFPTNTPRAASTATPSPTQTPEPTATPTLVPTPTLEPPYDHQIQGGEALYNIALRYAVSVDSIIAVNPGLSPERIVSGSTIQVPRPTATPPLEAVLISIGDETVMADPSDCTLHEIQDADTFFGIARTYSIPLDALLSMNRLSTETLLRPGDTVCIPTIVYNATSVDATSGDYGGAVDTEQLTLLYPPDSAEIEASSSVVTLQWLAQRNLERQEWYMIELTNLSQSDARPQRGFTKSTSFQVPAEWRTTDSADEQFRWRVSYVRANGERSDGAFVYSFGGPSTEATFILTP